MKRIWVENGFRGFYRGLGPTIFGYLPTWAIYFTVYDQSKITFANTLKPSGEEDFLNHILSAMTAGAVSTCCTSPLWVVKTRFMVRTEGWYVCALTLHGSFSRSKIRPRDHIDILATHLSKFTEQRDCGGFTEAFSQACSV